MDEIIKQMNCCLSDDNHIVIEPVILNCGGNACKQCVDDIQGLSVECFNCKQIHLKSDLERMPLNSTMKMLIEKALLKDVVAQLKSKLNDLLSEFESNDSY